MRATGWRAKWAAFRAEMARRAEGKPRLTLVTPKHRISGPTPVVPRNWFEPDQQAKLFGLAQCTNCGLAQLPGTPLHRGPGNAEYCGECAILLDADRWAPPAA